MKVVSRVASAIEATNKQTLDKTVRTEHSHQNISYNMRKYLWYIHTQMFKNGWGNCQIPNPPSSIVIEKMASAGDIIAAVFLINFLGKKLI